MTPTEMLMAEHRLIERVLDALAAAADELARGGAVRPEFFLDASDFVSGFADGCHHRKEEGVLFGAMIAHGAPPHGGAVAMMLEEHEQGRDLNRAMRDAAKRLGDGDPAARRRIIASARGYVALLRDHIAKEDEVLFPMADELIPPDAAAALVAAFNRLEQADGTNPPDHFLALATRLEHEAASLRQ
ncbi:MAG: hemerythrin domain-containing protein [Gemmatimonadaceae bacterium]|nr:hemerythrin domain-containing protein [Gemmatimonadaceae bacterium]